MINKYLNKTISIFLIFIFITALFPLNIFSESNPSSLSEIKGFNRSILDNHFSKADREINPERWLAEAKLGITQAIGAWELIAGNLYDNPLLFSEAKQQLENRSNEELEKRFSQWLVEKFFGNEKVNSLFNFFELLDETQKKYSWYLDQNGNILFDQKTGEPSVIRPNEENSSFSQDLIKWREQVNNHINNSLISFDNNLLLFYPELLTYIPSELRETTKSLIVGSMISMSGSIKTEFENIVAIEERKFISRRTRDIWSLRSKSEADSAKLFTEKLIAETEETCKNGINELNIKIEQAEAGAGDLSLLGEEWLKLYKEQFDRGLKAWEEAEERFFVRRIEWEQDSLDILDEGLTVWETAFTNFEKQRNMWEKNANELFKTGEKLFVNISNELEKSINDAKIEFEINKAMRIGEGTTKVKALVDMYLICASAAISSKENLQFWFEANNSQIKVNPNEDGFYSWLLIELNKPENITKEMEKIYDTQYITLKEMKYSYDMYKRYFENSLDARQRILDNYKELFETNTLTDFLSPDASSEDFYLDEFQIALIKAKALVIYYENKTKIAEAVSAYANESTSVRMTEAESLRALEDANIAYNASLKQYETELKALSKIGGELQSQQNKLTSLNAALQEEEAKLNQLFSDYISLISSSAADMQDIFYSELNNKYKLLVDYYKDFYQTENKIIFSNAINYGLNWSLAKQRENAQFILDLLINGNNNDIASLSSLEESGLEIDVKIRLTLIDLFSDDTSGGLRTANSTYSGADWYAKMKGIELSEKDKADYYGENLLNLLYFDYNSSLNKFVERLNNELDLFLNFLSKDSDAKPDNILIKNCVVDEESATDIFFVLLGLQGRLFAGESLYSDHDEENAILKDFLLGRSWFENNEYALPENYDNFYYYFNLHDNFNNYAFYSSFMQREIWQNSCLLLTDLPKKYDTSISTDFLPEPLQLAKAIEKKNGDIFQNTAQFLMDFDNCFTIIPEWLEIEIDIWKESFINFLAVYTLNNDKKEIKTLNILENEIKNIQDIISMEFDKFKKINISEEEIILINASLKELYELLSLKNYQYQITTTFKYYENLASSKEKHWREYLTDKYLKELDPMIISAANHKMGIYQDVYENTILKTFRINNVFSAYSNSEIQLSDLFASQLNKLYNSAASEISLKLNIFNNKFNEITVAAKAYDYSKLDIEEIIKEKLNMEENIKKQEGEYESVKINYLSEAEKFFNIGNRYNDQYSITKTAYENIEQNRFEYEKYAAIQRWASTSYLSADTIKLDEYKTKSERAKIVLKALTDLYENNETQSYNNPEYNSLYSSYKEIFSVKLFISEALKYENSEYLQELYINEQLYQDYYLSLNQLGIIDRNYNNYVLPEIHEKWTLKNIITVKNGLLAFSTDNVMLITGTDAKKAEELNKYFTDSIIPDNEFTKTTAYDTALRGLSERMSGYFKDENKFQQWSFAREYLISELINKNKNLKFLNSSFTGTGELNGGLASITFIRFKDKNYQNNDIYTLKEYFYPGIKKVMDIEYKNAWEKLTEQEKADLEFYTILTMNGQGEYFEGFSKMFSQIVYEAMYKEVKTSRDIAVDYLNKWYTFLFHQFLYEIRDVNNIALKRIKSIWNTTDEQVKKWEDDLQNYLSSIERNALSYKISCEKLNNLSGKNENSKNITWDDIIRSLNNVKRIEEKDIIAIKKYWENFISNPGNEYKTITETLNALLNYINNEEFEIKYNLEFFYLVEIQKQKEKETGFLAEVNSYIAGTGSMEKLKDTAEKTYGTNTLLSKKYYDDSYNVMKNNLSMYLEIDNNLFPLFNNLGDEISVLFGEMLDNKYNAELTAREIEWDLMRKDINEKKAEWKLSADLIMQTGRTDWITSRQKMEDARNQWILNFQNEIKRVRNEWNEAYLESLKDKEEWLRMAADAANNASSEAFLSLVGAEGERLSRVMDTREPLGIRIDINEADTLMAELLMSSGITNLSIAFKSINNITDSISTSVKRGLRGSAWDAALKKAAASDLARKANDEIAQSESRKLAYNAKLSAEEAKKSLTANVDSANKNFLAGMDDLFIFSGAWTKKGNNYEKDILKGSTLLTSIITEKATVKGYMNYVLEPINLKTNLDENYLASLDTLAIRGLLNCVYNEIEAITKDIFGTDEKPIPKPRIYKKNSSELKQSLTEAAADDMKLLTAESRREEIERSQSPGKFGAHIGFDPDQKPSKEMGESKKSMFYDQGGGELGRLVTDYIYWAVIDEKGNYELNMAPWEKRLWNDEDSWFKAPNLRTVGTIACSIIAGALTGGIGGFAGIAASIGISSSSEIIFTSLDIAYGYKETDEALFNLGKTILTNTASSLTGGLFNGIQGTTVAFQGLTEMATSLTTPALGQIAIKTAMTGIQTATTSLITNAINGISYSKKDGLGYNKNAFNSDYWNNMGTSMLTSMTGAFVNSSLTAINSGLDFSKLKGLNPLQKIEQGKLNDLIGSLAAQGVNYALGNDFTLNVLNASLFTGGILNGGLLEIHLGRNGVTGNIGMNGANVSIDNIDAAVKGAIHWNVNNRISKYGKNENFDALVTLRAQYGYGNDVQTKQLWDILNGDTRLNIINEDYDGKTVLDKGGKRVINLTGYSEGMSDEDQMRLAIILGHEAYRDGITTTDNYLETRSAAWSHTEMAIRMLEANENIKIDQNLLNDIIAYSKGKDNFNNYVDTNYDSSEDFWKLTKDGNLINNNSGWLVDELGKPILNKDGERIGANEIEQGLLNILFGGTHGVRYNDYADDQVALAQSLMLSAGMKFINEKDGDIRTRLWTSSITGQSLSMREIMTNVGSTVAAPVFARYYENTAIKLITLAQEKNIKSIIKGINANFVTSNAFSRFITDLLPTVSNYSNSMGQFLDPSDNFRIIQGHGGTNLSYPNYENNAHFGTDFVNGSTGDPIYMGIPGIVIYSGAEVEAGAGNGNWMAVEYGYRFGGSFIGSGIYGEYMHMEEKPNFANNTYLNSDQKIGTVGNTGRSTAPHLHYSIYTLENKPFSQTTLQYLFSINSAQTVISREAKSYIGTYNGQTARKVTYDIENYLNNF